MPEAIGLLTSNKKIMHPMRKKAHAVKNAILITGGRKKLKYDTPVKEDS